MATNRKDIELDPRFFVPPAVVDVRQGTNEDIYTNYNEDDIVTPNVGGPILDSPISTIPQAPSVYKIVSQTVRVGSDGSTVVDVLLEFPDNGEYDIDVRVTPA